MTEFRQTSHDLPDPAGPSPLRRPHSMRRTSTIDMTWPNGRSQAMHFHGVARDVFTSRDGGKPEVVHRDEMTATIAQDRTILALDSTPCRPDLVKLIGVRGGGYLRQALVEALPEEQRAGSPLFLLIDDISGTSLIAGWAWSRWPDENRQASDKRFDEIRRRMEGVCIGFRPGSSALATGKSSQQQHRAAPVVPLPHPEDPDGWHDLTNHSHVSMRRARRIDVWLALDGDIHVDAAFQDSASAPGGGRVAVHEYSLHVTVDPAALTIARIAARPHILPYPECPAAIGNVSRMEGKPLADLRALVLEELPRMLGCTHLNDALRALAEVPVLVRELRDRVAAPG